MQKKIGVFDSGYGGLNILQSFIQTMPQYDYVYLGDNARAPYGNRSFEVVYENTLNSVKQLFNLGCNLIILACNTSSAKALRSIQQNYLPTLLDKNKKVLGIIRPSTEIINEYTQSNHIGILATNGTVKSQSYVIEIGKFHKNIKVFQQAANMLVPLIENGEYQNEGCNYFIKKYIDLLLNQSSKIDMILLACTHYPIILNQIKQFVPPHIQIVVQGKIVANSLKNYLKRHPDLDETLSKNGNIDFYTSDNAEVFNIQSSIFFNQKINSKVLIY